MRKTKAKRANLKTEQNASPKEKKGKKNKNIIYNIIILICLAVIAYSIFMIISWAIENKRNNEILDDLHKISNITHEEVTIDNRNLEKRNYNFEELLKRNPQTVGWIYVPNSKIDYPIVQANDNQFYLDHSFDKSNNSAGWIFADYQCDVRNSQNVIIYGHNRKDASMFGSLKLVENDDWIGNLDNHYFNFASLDGTGIYKIFSTFVVNDEHVDSYLQANFSKPEDFKAYIKKIKNSSNYTYDTDIENTERIITLYTCYGMNNQRLLVFAAKVD